MHVYPAIQDFSESLPLWLRDDDAPGVLLPSSDECEELDLEALLADGEALLSPTWATEAGNSHGNGGIAGGSSAGDPFGGDGCWGAVLVGGGVLYLAIAVQRGVRAKPLGPRYGVELTAKEFQILRECI